MKRIIVILWSLGVGLMDFITGCLLVVVPMWTLERMGVPTPGGEALGYMSWLGVFVGMIGASYLLGLWKGAGVEMGTVWRLTAWIRLAVAVYVAVAIILRYLNGAWALVGVTDAVIGVVQVYGIRMGWLEAKK